MIDQSNAKLLRFARDIQGYNSYAPEFADVKFSIQLPSATRTPFTIPSDFKSYVMVFSYSNSYNLWASRNEDVEFPASSQFVLTSSELNPSPRLVYSGDVIEVVSASAIPELGVLLYGLS